LIIIVDLLGLARSMKHVPSAAVAKLFPGIEARAKEFELIASKLSRRQ